MKHLILGSSGQIGSALCEYLLIHGEQIIEFDIKRSIDEDLRCDSDLLDRSIVECDFVHFLAFDVGGAKYLDENQDKCPFISNNMKIMVTVFNSLRKYNKPFIFASSPNYPTNSYGMLKKLGEKMTLDLGGIVTRFWNVYGVEDLNDHSHVITDFIHMARVNGAIEMRTDGSELRQFLYSEDCAECLFKITQNYSHLKDRIQDVTIFEWNSIRDVANIVSTLINYGMIPWVPGNKNDGQNNARLEPRKTDILKYWQPKTYLRDGIQKLISKSQPD